MRLLNTSTYEIETKTGKAIPKYAILSHTWEEGQEVTYHEYTTASHRDDSSGPRKSGYKKIQDCCDLAKQHGLDWVWIDTCCIDKSSSSELSQSINSMFNYYHDSTVCFVFLSDLASPSHPKPSSPSPSSSLSECRWFKRGWTLQELLASRVCLFYDSRTLSLIGTKDSLADSLSYITSIRREYLLSPLQFLEASVAERMSWMADRDTTREEDKAYCLLGVFRVNMPLVYGEEGREAFQRLQREIVAQQDDDSIFAWLGDPGDERNYDSVRGVFARSPEEFRGCGDVRLGAFLDRRLISVIDRKAVGFPYSASSWRGDFGVMFAHITGFSFAQERVIGLRCVSAHTGKRLAIHVFGGDGKHSLWHRRDPSTRLYCESRFENLIASLSYLWSDSMQLSQDGPHAHSRYYLMEKPRQWWSMIGLIKLFMAFLGCLVTLLLLFTVHTYPMLLWGVSMLGWVISRESKLYLTIYLLGAILVQVFEYYTPDGQSSEGGGGGGGSIGS